MVAPNLQTFQHIITCLQNGPILCSLLGPWVASATGLHDWTARAVTLVKLLKHFAGSCICHSHRHTTMSRVMVKGFCQFLGPCFCPNRELIARCMWTNMRVPLPSGCAHNSWPHSRGLDASTHMSVKALWLRFMVASRIDVILLTNCSHPLEEGFLGSIHVHSKALQALTREGLHWH